MHRFMLIFFHKGKLFAVLSRGRRRPLIFFRFGTGAYESGCICMEVGVRQPWNLLRQLRCFCLRAAVSVCPSGAYEG